MTTLYFVILFGQKYKLKKEQREKRKVCCYALVIVS